MAIALRWFAALLSVIAAAVAGWLYNATATAHGSFGALDWLRLALTCICTFWLAWGAVVSVVGLVAWRRVRAPATTLPSRSRLALLVPIYNEDPQATFARVAAMSRGLSALGVHDRMDVFLLSDTRSADIAALEVVWFQRLLAECQARDAVYYRRRPDNIARKAGNIEDFIRRSGAAYDYAIVLDADSLMEPAAIVELVRRMDDNPDLGLLQTVPVVIRARSVFARAAQFATAFYSPAYACGTAALQGTEGPYWGHNAIFRVRAFAESCGLPRLKGKPPFGGHILSHDYVEAALLARAGWHVRLAPDIPGSFEEGPENILDYAKRDKRWCQGNLQHGRLLLAPGLRFWNRYTLLQGILAYVQAPLWVVLIFLSLTDNEFALFASPEARWADLALLGLIGGLLFLPKLLIVLHGMVTGRNRAFGGTLRVLRAVVFEIGFSSLLTPTLLLLQARAVGEILSGFDGGWPASNRSDGRVMLRTAIAATGWMALAGILVLVAVLVLAPDLAVWSLLTVVPLIGAPWLVAASSRVSRKLARVWRVPAEDSMPPVLSAFEEIYASWGGARDAQAVFGPPRPPALRASVDVAN